MISASLLRFPNGVWERERNGLESKASALGAFAKAEAFGLQKRVGKVI